MIKPIIYASLVTGLTLALLGSAGSVLAKDKQEDKGKSEAPRAPRTEAPKARPAEQPRVRQPEPPKITRPAQQPRRVEQPKAPPRVEQPRRIEQPKVQQTQKIEIRGGARNEQPRNVERGPRESVPKANQLPTPGQRPALPKPDLNPGNRGERNPQGIGPRIPQVGPNLPGTDRNAASRENPPQRGKGPAESDIQQRLRERFKDNPKGPDRPQGDVKGPGGDRGGNPPQRGVGGNENELQQQLRDRAKVNPKGPGRPQGDVKPPTGDRKPGDPGNPPRAGKDGDKATEGARPADGDRNRPNIDLKPGVPGRGTRGEPENRGKPGDNLPKLPDGVRPGRGDRPDGKPGIDLGNVKGRPDLNQIDKRPNRLPMRIEKDGGAGKFADKGELNDQLKHLQRARNPDDFRKEWKQLRDRDDIRHDPLLKNVNLDRVSGGFQNRLADRDWDNLRHTRFASKVNLDRQFGLYGRGDVARQLNLSVNLNQRGGWGHRFYGPIAPAYRANHFSIWYPGASWYPRSVWCPRWSPWVAWSWWSRPAVFFDPRPIYCRPAVWDPCPTWVYYDYPVWQSLPVVASGTWVDVPTVQLEPQSLDLQVLAVRFVDPGHPEESIGPRFRMWLRNNSPVDLATPFNVMLLASADTHADASLPQSGSTVDRIGAGETLAVDIRLPFEANRVAKDDVGRSVPFNFLHALVDSHRELEEVNEANNGVVLARGDILPVDPAAFSTDVTAAAPGAVVTLAGEGLGPEPGQVIVTFNGLEQDAEIHGWYDLGIQFRLPNVPLASPVDAEIVVIRGDGAVSNPVTVQITPQSMLTEAPPLPVPPLPAQ